MKISKLFHWLYAILMLLPFAFFVPSVLYYAFNDNATMQTIEVPNTETIGVDFNQKILPMDELEKRNSLSYYNPISESETSLHYTGNGIWSYQFCWDQELIVGHKYLFKYNLDWTCSDDTTGFYISGGNIKGTANFFIKSVSPGIYNEEYIYSAGYPCKYLFTYCSRSANYEVAISDLNCFDLTQMFGAGNEPTIAKFNQMFPNNYYSYTESELMQITYDTGETKQLVENTDIINYAWESIWDLPLFSWSKVSFVAVPMTFLTGMFGLAASNSLNYVFAYFVSISIIYLLFDVIMYFPLMVHRWIDKARLE